MTQNQDNRIVELLESMLAEQKGMREDIGGLKAEMVAVKEEQQETNQRLQAVENEQKGMRSEQQQTNQRLQAVEAQQQQTNQQLHNHEKRLGNIEHSLMAAAEEQLLTRKTLDSMRGEQVLLRDEFERMRTSFLRAYEMRFEQLEEHLTASLSEVIKTSVQDADKEKREEIEEIKKRISAIEQRVFPN
jgi:chromosome segregation ATPase